MISLNNIDYEIKTPLENCTDMINYINNYCASNNIKNSKGEIIYIEANETNPLYMILFGLGYLVSKLQKLIYSVGTCFDIASSTERQLLNIADIAGVRRKRASKTTIPCVIYANNPTTDKDNPAVNCIITTSLSCTIKINEKNVVFHPAYEATLLPGDSVAMHLISEEPGSYVLIENTFTQFDENPAGFRKMITEASVPGQELESIPALRERIQNRQYINTPQARCAQEIEALEGVNKCSIYFNYSFDSEQIIGTGETAVTVPPQKAVLLVQGWNENIARTFFNYLLCNTVGNAYSEVQKYRVSSADASVLSVYITRPASVPLYVRVYVQDTIGQTMSTNVRDVIASLAKDITIGEQITSAMLVDKIKSVYPTLNVQGIDVSRDNESFSYKVNVSENELFTFNSKNIAIVAENNI